MPENPQHDVMDDVFEDIEQELCASTREIATGFAPFGDDERAPEDA